MSQVLEPTLADVPNFLAAIRKIDRDMAALRTTKDNLIDQLCRAAGPKEQDDFERPMIFGVNVEGKPYEVTVKWKITESWNSTTLRKLIDDAQKTNHNPEDLKRAVKYKAEIDKKMLQTLPKHDREYLEQACERKPYKADGSLYAPSIDFKELEPQDPPPEPYAA